jgi:hypothetical protein
MAKTIGQLTQATTIGGADELVIEQSGLTKRVAASVVRGGLVNADIDAAAAIAHTKLANITAGRVLLGNASNVPTATELTGDVTVSSSGVTSIAANAVVTADIADAAVTPAKLSQPLTLATAQNTTSGTSIDFTGIPSWVKRITVLIGGVSVSGSSGISIRIGDSGGLENSGYLSGISYAQSGNQAGAANSTSEYLVALDFGAAQTISGHAVLANISGNIWSFSSVIATSSNFNFFSGGSKTLSAALDRLSLFTSNGTDTFDAGSVNIMYEG